MNAERQRIAEHVQFWCPGCDHLHQIVTWRAGGGDVWTWDGNQDRPTVSPSILVTGGSGDLTCHSFLRDGRWEFLADSTHALAGQTVDMVPLPEWLVRDDA